MELQGSPEIVGSGSEIGVKKGMVLPFLPLSMAFDRVNYYVDMPAVSCSIFLSIFLVNNSKAINLRIPRF